ncbi:MAG: ATP-dependent DNA helicase RecG [Coxiellaceae bacterium]|nr:ATP-dependent DNA helicase RecG [Coxiellaceae bacterium]
MPEQLAKIAISQLKGVGPRMATLLQNLSIHTVQDILFHLPLRYEDRTRVISLAQCKPGDRVMTKAVIDKTWQAFGKRKMLLCQLRDGNRKLTLRFFHYTSRQANYLKQTGKAVCCFGEIRLGQFGLEIVHPQYSILDDGEALQLSDYLTPVYPTTEGLGQATLIKLTDQALQYLVDGEVENYLPQQDVDMTTEQALQLLHRPPAKMHFQQRESELEKARRRLALEELVAYQLQLKSSRRQVKKLLGYDFKNNAKVIEEFKKQLPFDLTGAQKKAMAEIEKDIFSHQPMMRLLQGDVGSGKTMIALISLLHAVSNGYQAVLMAPTEILAEQHLQQCQQWLEPLGVRVTCLVGSLKQSEHTKIQALIANHEVDVVVGTHAVFQQKIQYAKLALMVIDEQHRFGVHQRMALQLKGKKQGRVPHQLIMTATPIPRTLAMTAYADLDYSVIDELPPGRKPIQTVLCSQSQREALIARLANYCEQGRQAYWVCTLIEESEMLQAKAAQDVCDELKRLLPNCRIALVHGRIKADEKQRIMTAFHQAELDVLVATTVIEVGVNVPNASVMVIDNAERLGLSQLHQLRGRVGRGEQQSYCVLQYKSPLSQIAQQRLELMRQSQDGFEIAQADLRLRGAGEILGSRQSGVIGFRIADMEMDADLISVANQLSEQLIDGKMVQQLCNRWGIIQSRELVTV